MANTVYININTQASVALINKLESLHRSGMPLAVRGTLNAAAFDVKQRTLDDSATQNFIRRSPTFFKRFSGVNRAQGFDINSMHADVGMTTNGQTKAEAAISHMVQVEHGGKVTDGLDYLAAARTSTNLSNSVRTNKRFDKTKTIKDQNLYSIKTRKRIGTTKSRRVAAAYAALNTGLYQKTNINGRNFYRTVTSISKIKKGKVKIRSKLVYLSRSSGIKPIQATHFSQEASERTQPLIPQFFNKEAQKQINRLWK